MSLIKMVGVISFLLLVSCEEEVKPCCDCNKITRAIDVYEYPIKPGTAEWASLKNGSEMLEVCQLPDSILYSISTYGLFISCLEFPIFNQINAYKSLQEGMDYFMENFNGMSELKKRKNDGEKTSELYKLMVISCYDTIPPNKSALLGAYTFKFTHIEMLMAQPGILSSMNNAIIRDLFKEALIKYQQKKTHQNLYGIYGLKTTSFLMLHIMKKMNYDPILNEITQNNELRYFSETVDLQGHFELLDIIYNHSLDFIII